MTAVLTPAPKAQFLTNNGEPLVGGKLYSYAAGTTTPLATYTTYAGNVANTNPVILDSRGEANVWLTSGVLYKLALYDADNALIWTVDNVSSINDGLFSGPVSGTTATFSGALTAASGTFSGNVQMASANGGQLAGLRNKIINGNMDIFQRGTTAVTVSSIYGPADRWQSNGVGDTFSTTQGSFVSGDTLFDTGGAQYFTTTAVTSVAGAGNFLRLLQAIEDVRLLAEKTVTVSFWAKAASGTPTIGVGISQNFGTGGSASVNVAGQSQVITSTWAQYTKTFSIPSINGKTVGTNNTHSTVLSFYLDAGSTYNIESGSIGQASKTVSIAQVQLEIGPVATPFEFRPIGMELALCQRYYYRISPAAASAVFSIGGYATTTTSTAVMTPFPVTMRVAPSALEQTGTATDYSVLTAGGGTIVCSAVPTISAVGVSNVRTAGTVASGLTAGQGAELRSSNANAYLGWSAEL